MKKLLLAVLTLVLLVNCMNGTRSRKTQNRRSYPPEKLFEDKYLPVAQAVYNGSPEKVAELIEGDKLDVDHISPNGEYTLLMYATIIEDMEVMKKLLDMGSDPDECSPARGLLQNPVTHATAMNNFKMLKLLLSYKATLNNKLGQLPINESMMLGTEKMERPMVDFLLKNGADVNHQSYGDDLILAVAFRDGLETANYFLDKGADPLLVGKDGENLPYMLQRKQEQFDKLNKRNEYYDRLMQLKKRLETEYGVVFPIKEDTKAGLIVLNKLYDKLSERDKQILGEKGKVRYERIEKKIAELE